jgi:regulator of RNase E activity RraA
VSRDSQPDYAAVATRVGCAPICDALDRRFGHRAHLHDLVAPPSGRVLSGRAVTMRFLPLRRDRVEVDRHDFGALLAHASGDRSLADHVLVAAADDPEQAVAGGKKLSRLRNLGMRGLLTDGRVRDMAEAAEMGLAVWCRGEAVRNANEVLMAWELEVPVSVGGAAVFPGDWIHADASGAVVIPGAEVDEVLQDAVAIVERDAAQVERLRAEDVARTPGG